MFLEWKVKNLRVGYSRGIGFLYRVSLILILVFKKVAQKAEGQIKGVPSPTDPL